MHLTDKEQQQLVTLAWDSIHFGLTHRKLFAFDSTGLTAALRESCATFVTLHTNGDLRGCIGAIDAIRPLADDVVHNAHAAAFRDHRFEPLVLDEFAALDLSISVLTPRQYLSFDSEQDLLAQLRPGIDGVVLEDNRCCGAFLPVMWERLPEPADFIRQLKRKAGLPADYWSPTIRVSRFSCGYYIISGNPPQELLS